MRGRRTFGTHGEGATHPDGMPGRPLWVCYSFVAQGRASGRKVLRICVPRLNRSGQCIGPEASADLRHQGRVEAFSPPEHRGAGLVTDGVRSPPAACLVACPICELAHRVELAGEIQPVPGPGEGHHGDLVAGIPWRFGAVDAPAGPTSGRGLVVPEGHHQVALAGAVQGS